MDLLQASVSLEHDRPYNNAVACCVVKWVIQCAGILSKTIRVFTRSFAARTHTHTQQVINHMYKYAHLFHKHNAIKSYDVIYIQHSV